MDYIEITNSQFRKGLETKRNMMVFGPSGYGKTATVEGYAEDAGLKIAYCDMAGQLPEAIAGIPAVVTTKDTTTGYYRRMLDIELKEFLESEGEGWLLFFDEINQGSQESLNTLYSITHPNPDMRRWAGHRLGKCQIVACGNLSDGTDGTVYLTDLPTPLLNRFFVFKLKPSRKDATDYLKKKWKNIPQVTKYIKTMLDADIAPRDIDLALDILQYDHDAMFLEAKLGTALTAKIYDLQKGIKSLDPAELLKNARKVYEQFQEDGEVMWAGETVTTETELKTKFEDLGLSEEEIAGIMKGGK
ncbi:MAG: AAA family ATPase [Anaeroplasmataceae bacterium]|nr:AAA family ATPase [Anaeroplasmataceae bacterium]